MVETARKTKVTRYFKAKPDSDGAPTPGTEDEDIWIDIELLTGFVTEAGEGVDFRRKFWTLDWASTARTIVWKKVFQDEDNDPDTYVLVPVPKKAVFESGEGLDYRRFSLEFDNSPQNVARDVAVFRVFHAEFASDSATVDVDRDAYLNVEVIRKYSEEFGEGVDYVREIWFPANATIPADPELPEEQYKVREKPGAEEGNPQKIWPSHREEQ